MKTDVKSEQDLLPPGAAPGTIPTDLEQATGLERLEILGKMQGIDIFDMKPLDASRTGTYDGNASATPSLLATIATDISGPFNITLMASSRNIRQPNNCQIRWRRNPMRLHRLPRRLACCSLGSGMFDVVVISG